MTFDYDLFVIGGGSGGVRSARLTAELGYKVGLAEEYRMGGTCVIRGCVPKKLMVYASQFSEHFEDAIGFGWTVGERSFDWGALKTARDAEIARLENIYRTNLGKPGVEIFDARAELKDAHTVRLSSGEEFSAKHILIATGGKPFVPDVPGAEHGITSDDVFNLTEQPNRIAIVGGGYISCEFASIFNGLGTQVTIIHRGQHILRGFDQEVGDFVADQMREKGVEIALGADVASIEKQDHGLVVTTESGASYVVDQIMFGTGRHPNSDNMGLEAAGVAMDRKTIKVDGYSQTSVPSIYAVGDVTDRVALTPVAIREGVAFVESVFKGNPMQPDHELIPTAVFTQPEIGTIGIAEEDADEPVDVYVAKFRPMMHILANKSEQMLMKLIVSQKTDKVLGCHIVGHAAGEMIQMAGIAVKMGATKAQFDATMAVHPTAAEELVTMKSPTRST